MENYRLAALDMDGTLLNSAHALTDYTRGVLRRATSAGRIMALCTGRCLSELRYLLDELDGVSYAIAVNGGRLYDLRARRSMRSLNLPAADAEWILGEAMRCDACHQIILGDESFHDFGGEPMLSHYHMSEYGSLFEAGSTRVNDLEARRREHADEVGKINVFFAGASDKRRFLARLEGRAVSWCDAVTMGVEITPVGATKAQGLRALCELLGVPVSQSMAVGDGGNDLPVMRAAGFSVAMGNAIPEVRAAANAFTDDCDHDGAARAIERFMGV